MTKTNGVSLTKEQIKALIIKEVPKLVKSDLEIRNFILRISSERYADKARTEDRIDRLIDELRKDREENQKKWEENQRNLERSTREWNQKWEENQKVINSMLEEIKNLHRKYDKGIGAIGARWGFRAEGSFRDAMRGILQEHFPVKVERYRTMDEEGIVFGSPDQIELDLIVRDGKVIVAEIKSSISKEQVAAFLRKVRVYESKEGREVTQKIIISPMIEGRALEFAEKNGVKAYGYPEEVELSKLQDW